jgi:hypothetical protein
MKDESMKHIQDNPGKSGYAAEQSPVWRRALISVFGAAHRLHRYRDAQDVLLQNVIYEQERRMRQQACCDEQS